MLNCFCVGICFSFKQSCRGINFKKIGSSCLYTCFLLAQSLFTFFFLAFVPHYCRALLVPCVVCSRYRFVEAMDRAILLLRFTLSRVFFTRKDSSFLRFQFVQPSSTILPSFPAWFFRLLVPSFNMLYSFHLIARLSRLAQLF